MRRGFIDANEAIAGIDGRIVMLLLGGAAVLVVHRAGLHDTDIAVLQHADVQEAAELRLAAWVHDAWVVSSLSRAAIVLDSLQ